jgi:hypothetical protein
MKNPARANDWYNASLKKNVDWDNVFNGYQATVDWPGCSFYKELHEKYPDAKVILTVRDPDEWYTSTYETIYAMSKVKRQVITWLFPNVRNMKRMIFGVIWDGTFKGKFEDKEYAKTIFQQHTEEVERTIPKEKLLIYEITEGWEPLCKFLDVTVPEGEPFPRVNDTESMKKLLRKRQLFSIIIYSTILMLLILMLILIFT